MPFLTNNEQICDAIVNAAMLLICKEQHLTFNQQHDQPPYLHLAQLKPFLSIIMKKVTL